MYGVLANKTQLQFIFLLGLFNSLLISEPFRFSEDNFGAPFLDAHHLLDGVMGG